MQQNGGKPFTKDFRTRDKNPRYTTLAVSGRCPVDIFRVDIFKCKGLVARPGPGPGPTYATLAHPGALRPWHVLRWDGAGRVFVVVAIRTALLGFCVAASPLSALLLGLAMPGAIQAGRAPS